MKTKQDACLEKLLQNFTKKSTFEALYRKTKLSFSCSFQERGAYKVWNWSSKLATVPSVRVRSAQIWAFFEVPFRESIP